MKIILVCFLHTKHAVFLGGLGGEGGGHSTIPFGTELLGDILVSSQYFCMSVKNFFNSNLHPCLDVCVVYLAGRGSAGWSQGQ